MLLKKNVTEFTKPWFLCVTVQNCPLGKQEKLPTATDY